MGERRVAVITGGAGGMGLACARRLADADTAVLLADLPGERLDAAVEALRGEGIVAEAAACDVSDTQAVTALAERAGALVTLVHTAGLAPPLATDAAAILAINVAGTARVLDAFEPRIGAGSVAVCVASMGGYRREAASADDALEASDLERLEAVAGDDTLTAYALSKRGVMLECRRRAAAWGAKGARIVSISPGLIADTTIGEAAATVVGSYAERSALGRAGTAAEVADVVAFLASPAAGYVTGCDILVDGGVLAEFVHHGSDRVRAAWGG